jgi:hypothetical protein
MHNVWSSEETATLTLDTVQDVSFYDLVDRLWHKAITPKWPLHRFLSLVRLMGVTHFIEEEIHVETQEESAAASELRYELEAIALRTDVAPGSLKYKIKRFTFVWALADATLSSLSDANVAGYFVHIDVQLPNGKHVAYLFESVLRKPMAGTVDSSKTLNLQPINRFMYLHCSSDFQTTCGRGEDAKTFTVHGTFFTQQNLLTHVCAHAALRMGINSAKHLTGGQKLTNQAINDALGIDHRSPGSRIGTYYAHPNKDDIVTRGRGLTSDELKIVLMSPQLDLKLDCVLLNCKQMAELEFDHFMYPYMESGWPALIGLEGTNLRSGKQVDHVLCTVGHTLDPFHWSPEARQGYGMLPRHEVMSAVEWTDHFVINDDGYGMHMTLQSDVVRNVINPNRNASLHVMFVMALRPRAVTYDGSNATQIASTIFKNMCDELKGQKQFKPCKWYTRMTDSTEIVCRTMHITRSQYIDSFQNQAIDHIDKMVGLLQALPEHFWLTELTLPPLYAGNAKKLGDVIVRADDPLIKDQTGRPVRRVAKEVLDTQWEFIWTPGVAKFRNKHLIAWPVKEPVKMVGTTGSLTV